MTRSSASVRRSSAEVLSALSWTRSSSWDVDKVFLPKVVYTTTPTNRTIIQESQGYAHGHRGRQTTRSLIIIGVTHRYLRLFQFVLQTIILHFQALQLLANCIVIVATSHRHLSITTTSSILIVFYGQLHVIDFRLANLAIFSGFFVDVLESECDECCWWLIG